MLSFNNIFNRNILLWKQCPCYSGQSTKQTVFKVIVSLVGNRSMKTHFALFLERHADLFLNFSSLEHHKRTSIHPVVLVVEAEIPGRDPKI